MNTTSSITYLHVLYFVGLWPPVWPSARELEAPQEDLSGTQTLPLVPNHTEHLQLSSAHGRRATWNLFPLNLCLTPVKTEN